MELAEDDVLKAKLYFARVQDYVVQDLKRWLACRILPVLDNKNLLVESNANKLLTFDTVADNRFGFSIVGPLY